MEPIMINLIKDYSKIFITRLCYNADGLNTYIYFSNNKLFSDKNIINDTHGSYHNIINGETVVIDHKDVTSYSIDFIDHNLIINPGSATDKDLENQKDKILSKIEEQKRKITKTFESLTFLRKYMREDQYKARFEVEFEAGVTNIDEYLYKVAYNKVFSDRFNYYFLCKKLDIDQSYLFETTPEKLEIVKQKWKEYLVTYVKHFVNYLNSEINLIPESDIEYQQELKLLIKEIEDEIVNIHFDNANTAFDVVKVWPTLVSPPPFFLEDIV